MVGGRGGFGFFCILFWKVNVLFVFFKCGCGIVWIFWEGIYGIFVFVWKCVFNYFCVYGVSSN